MRMTLTRSFSANNYASRPTACGLLAVVLCLLSTPPLARAERPTTVPATAPATHPAATFSGEWRTTFGTMRLTQTADRVEGTYGTDAAGVEPPRQSRGGPAYVHLHRAGSDRGGVVRAFAGRVGVPRPVATGRRGTGRRLGG